MCCQMTSGSKGHFESGPRLPLLLYISIENLSELDENKLVDKTFIKIINMISNKKALNNDTWKQF